MRIKDFLNATRIPGATSVSRRFLGSLDALCRTDMLLGYSCVGGGGFLAEPRNLDLVEAGVNVTGRHEIPHGRLQRFVPHPGLNRSDVEARAKHACCIRGSEGFQIEL